MDRAFDRIFIIMLENELESAVLQDDYMRGLQGRGARLSDYHGVTHPSQPNYFATVAGLPLVTSDECQDIEATSIVDLLEAKGITWRAYMEDLPEDDKAVCITADRLYFRKHNPFVSLNGVRNVPARLANVVNAGRLRDDIDAGALPQLCWYTPNIQNDGHSPPNSTPAARWNGVTFLSGWLRGFLEPLLVDPKFREGTLVVVTFDESIPYEDNHVYTTLLGAMVEAGSVEADRYDHYSLLRTVEENFGLGTLGRNDLTTNWFRFLWGLKPPAFDLADHVQ
jgi:phospholipase C